MYRGESPVADYNVDRLLPVTLHWQLRIVFVCEHRFANPQLLQNNANLYLSDGVTSRRLTTTDHDWPQLTAQGGIECAECTQSLCTNSSVLQVQYARFMSNYIVSFWKRVYGIEPTSMRRHFTSSPGTSLLHTAVCAWRLRTLYAFDAPWAVSRGRSSSVVLKSNPSSITTRYFTTNSISPVTMDTSDVTTAECQAISSCRQHVNLSYLK